MSFEWPGRSLIFSSVAPDGALVLGCDCGLTTHVQIVIEDGGELRHAREVAVTCDGCCTVRWITVSPAAPGTAGPSP